MIQIKDCVLFNWCDNTRVDWVYLCAWACGWVWVQGGLIIIMWQITI